jgi:predicted lipoprotein with Yx(FWY)xxD motif
MRTKRFGGLAIAAAALALLAACSSSGNSTGSASAPTVAANQSGSGASASSAAMVKTTSGSLGTFLTDGAGRTLYLWVADKAGPSTCYDACAQAWPPLLTNGAPAAGNGVDASKLGTTDRKDGTKQVTYNGNPLYYYFGDSAAGDTTGQGSDNFGAKWWAVAPSGAAITGSGGGQSSSSSSGYNY